MVCSVAHAAVQSLHPLVANPDLGETKQPWPGLERSLWECEGRARVLVEHIPLTLAVFALVQPCPCCPGQGSINWLSSFLRAVETHSLLSQPCKSWGFSGFCGWWWTPAPLQGRRPSFSPAEGGTAMELYGTAGQGTEQP